MKQIRVMVVDDSAFMRKMITNMLESDQQITVIGTAKNGEEALKKAVSLSPDVITLDIEMPVMDGLTVLKNLMQQNPLPVIMVSSLTQKSAEMTLKALEDGAVDFIAKPSGAISLDIETVAEELKAKVLTAAVSNMAMIKEDRTKKPETTSWKNTVVAIGTSTGGPKALQQVLPELPSDFPFPLVIVQHMPAGFTRSLAQRLNSLSGISVKEAEEGEELKNGTAYIAPGGYHFRIKQVNYKLICQITDEPAMGSHRPSVDILYNSLAELKSVKIISVIMTGMGTDGSKGLIQLKKSKKDTYAISESAATSVVYGMPQSAMKTGLIDQEEDVQNISAALMRLLSSPRRK